MDCNMKYRCTGRDNSSSIFDCCWDQDDSPGECELQNSVPVVSGTVTDNNQEQSDSAKSQDNNVNHRDAQNTTPAVDHHNDNIMNDGVRYTTSIELAVVILCCIFVCMCGFIIIYIYICPNLVSIF